MDMNETLRETMRQELAQSRGGFGIAVGVIAFFGLCTLGGLVPGFATLIEAHDWLLFAILVISVGAGYVAGTLRATTIRNEIKSLDDDTLKFRHDQMSRRKQLSSIAIYIVVAFVVAYLIFRT